ncbi:hypothetical protein [Methylovulum psychrotolerans]|uniref:hypothetical protein n=1 Tax=Methylovulum psychrotolerans TaxID=1704499 RepID=UPI000CDEF3A4|nr:hypothetical protein [Methylovulum psychrotolerans]
MNDVDAIIAMMDNKSLEAMTDDDIDTLRRLLIDERVRRERSGKKPVFVVSGVIRKDLKKSLAALKNDIEDVLSYEKGCEAYFDHIIKQDKGAILLSLKLEFWNESEYEARPDEVFTSS